MAPYSLYIMVYGTSNGPQHDIIIWAPIICSFFGGERGEGVWILCLRFWNESLGLRIYDVGLGFLVSS